MSAAPACGHLSAPRGLQPPKPAADGHNLEMQPSGLELGIRIRTALEGAAQDMARLRPLRGADSTHRHEALPPPPILSPEFDTCRIHGWDFPRQNKGIRRGPEGAVYLGAQASCRMGGGLEMFRDFKRLSASGEGSVTCQTVPFGLDN